MRIWHQSFVDMEQAPAYAEALQRLADAVARPGTEVVVHGMRPGTYGGFPTAQGVRYAYLHHLLVTQVLDNVRRAQAEGYDAFAIVTLQDPGLREARSLVDIPVVGYGESAMHLACMLGDRFGIVAFNEPLFPVWRDQITAYGLADRSVATTLLEADYPDLVESFEDPGSLLTDFEASAREAIAKGADVLIPGQALLGALLTSHGLVRVDDAPIIDPLGASLKIAEGLHDLARTFGVTVTRRGFFYERPPDELATHMRGMLS